MKKYQHNKRKQCYVSLNKINLTKNYSLKINLRRIEDDSHIVDGKNITRKFHKFENTGAYAR